jgi:hypothetical protein
VLNKPSNLIFRLLVSTYGRIRAITAVLCVIRLSKPTYDSTLFTDCGIEFYELFFNDDTVSPANLLDTYRSFLQTAV